MHADPLPSLEGGFIIWSPSNNDTTLDRVGPILLASNGAEINLGGDSRFSNSTDDHDIRAGTYSSINWGDEVVGSGGLTDKWERRLAGQSLTFDAMFVTYEISGMHRFPSYSNFSNEVGVSFIDGGRERVGDSLVRRQYMGRERCLE